MADSHEGGASQKPSVIRGRWRVAPGSRGIAYERQHGHAADAVAQPGDESSVVRNLGSALQGLERPEPHRSLGTSRWATGNARRPAASSILGMEPRAEPALHVFLPPVSWKREALS